MSAGFHLRGELRLKNDRLIARREQLGMSQAAFADYMGITYSHYNGYETMRTYPGAKHRARLAAECDCSEAELFPPQLKKYAEGKAPRIIVSTAVVDPARLLGSVRREVLALPAESTPETTLLADEQRKVLRKSLAQLPPREQKLIALYFGFDGNAGKTLEEVGRVLGVTAEKARQIKDRALMRLRREHRLLVDEWEAA